MTVKILPRYKNTNIYESSPATFTTPSWFKATIITCADGEALCNVSTNNINRCDDVSKCIEMKSGCNNVIASGTNNNLHVEYE